MVSVRVFFILASALLISDTVTVTEQQEATAEQPFTEELVVNVTQANNETITDVNDDAVTNLLTAANTLLSQLPSKDKIKERLQTLRQALMKELRGLRVVLMSTDCKQKKSTCSEASLRTAKAAVTLSRAIAETCPNKKERIENIIAKPIKSPDYGVFRLSNVISVTNAC